MTVWLVAGAMALAALAWLMRSVLRAGRAVGDRSSYETEIYKDQLQELEREAQRGLIEKPVLASLRVEIQRRLIAGADQARLARTYSMPSILVASSLAVVLLGIGAGLYASLGSANLADQPLAERMLKRHQEVANTEDTEALVRLLQRKTEEDPDNLEQWLLLARSFAFLERYGEAADAYRRASAAGGDRPEILSAYAEAMTLANGNRVTNEARLVFEQVLAVMPEDTRARYYIGLADAQAQNYRQAMDRWLALLNDAPQGAPWAPQVREHVLDMAAFLGIDAKTVLPDVTPEELTATAGATTPEAAEETIESLKTRLESEPKDYRAWLALARLQVEAGDVDGARASLERVSELYAAAPFVQQEIRQAAAALGLDAASESGAAAQPGPTESDMAAAADMTEGERSVMIKGMVAGLAARLDQEPDDLEGWVMLIRSYSILGDRGAASQAFAQARDHFTGNQDAVQRLDETAAEFSVQAPEQ